MAGDGDGVICNLGCEEEVGETKRRALRESRRAAESDVTREQRLPGDGARRTQLASVRSKKPKSERRACSNVEGGAGLPAIACVVLQCFSVPAYRYTSNFMSLYKC